MVKSLVILALVAVLASTASATFTDNEVDILFTQWAVKHGKEYAHEGLRQYRRAVFHDNLNFVSEHNALYQAGHRTFEVALNEFADLTNQEFRRLMNMQPVDLAAAEKILGEVAEPHIPSGLPPRGDSFDWRSQGAVTKPKNQGQCGSCWSFSATGAMEGAWKIAGHSLVSLSEQQLVDCSGSYGNQGCNGGLPGWAFSYVAQHGGIESESDYPYQARQNSCKVGSNVAARISGYRNITAGSESALKDAVTNKGPVSVAIDAGNQSFQFYSRGVYNEPRCSSTKLDHGVLAVGYSSDSGKDYWIVKNSWGSSWGQQGYIWMSRNANNQCGIATLATYPVV